MMKGHKPGDMFTIGARVPTEEELEGAKAGDVEENERLPQHIILHAHSLERPGGPKPPAKKSSPLDYLKSRQK